MPRPPCLTRRMRKPCRAVPALYQYENLDCETRAAPVPGRAWPCRARAVACPRRVPKPRLLKRGQSPLPCLRVPRPR
eukprot:6544880-Pyramimonas_sp.AAC.1